MDKLKGISASIRWEDEAHNLPDSDDRVEKYREGYAMSPSEDVSGEPFVCAVKDVDGDHCTENPTHRLNLPGDDPFWLCDRCYETYNDLKRRGVIGGREVVIVTNQSSKEDS